MVVDSSKEDAYGSDGHGGSHDVETETVHRPGDPTPVILLLQNTRVPKGRSNRTILLRCVDCKGVDSLSRIF